MYDEIVCSHFKIKIKQDLAQHLFQIQIKQDYDEILSYDRQNHPNKNNNKHIPQTAIARGQKLILLYFLLYVEPYHSLESLDEKKHPQTN